MYAFLIYIYQLSPKGVIWYLRVKYGCGLVWEGCSAAAAVTAPAVLAPNRNVTTPGAGKVPSGSVVQYGHGGEECWIPACRKSHSQD